MTAWPARPVIHEVNTAVWLNELSRVAQRAVTLADVRSADWDAVTPAGVDAVWLMGVWERSPVGLALADANPELQEAFHEALPDLDPDDVIGSPYCVRRYVADAAFGGPQGLAAARAALAERGVRLVLDYVPNHVAPDHPLVSTRPDMFIQGSPGDLERDPRAWSEVAGHILAHGRDPYFPPWPDVMQLNAFAPATRAVTVDTMRNIAAQCDAIRCDMAMLLTNDIFATTWGECAGPRPNEDFWPEVIREVKGKDPDLLLIAEAYWDYEWRLQQQGFDFCYDKTLYDRLVRKDPIAVRDHLRAGIDYQSRLLRFIENHDEPRIADRVTPEAEQACAVALATLPGAVLWHEGQFEGRRVHLPVFLRRRPDEAPDPALRDWHHNLLATVADHRVRDGDWALLDVAGWPDNPSCRNLLAWSWTADTARHLIVVNLSDRPAQGRVRVPWADLAGRRSEIRDLVSKLTFPRDGDELIGSGLFVALNAWQYHLLAIP